ncbi:MAG: sugar ABC transporter permease [Chloroflexota bacterium]|nr:sugar ABC transporter permease [Chloroflexota bacterium]MDE2855651.1 sugar ABC transporter permease [Chloroflexota bacterium]MDE2948386.1 sugar ABC transporter permease [Chloroflexota bacterium]
MTEDRNAWGRRPGWLAPAVLILPAFVVVFAIAGYSALSLFQLSTVDLTFGEPFSNAEAVGLENYQWLLTNQHSTFWATLRVTVIYLLGTLIPELLLGFAIALLLNRKMRGNSLFTAVLVIPIVLMPSMVGLIGRLYFSYDGLVNYFFEILTGIRHNWYGKDLALLAVILVDIWEWSPFFILILLAGLQTLPIEPFEAARVDGASRWQSFTLITLPLMLPLLLTTLILRFMDVLRLFDVIFVMFAGGPGTATTTLPLYVYRSTLVLRDVGRGSAASIMLIIIIVSLTVILIKVRERIKFEV